MMMMMNIVFGHCPTLGGRRDLKKEVATSNVLNWL